MYIGYKIGYRDGIDYENHKGHTWFFGVVDIGNVRRTVKTE
jgi:hypothetical protein